MSSASAVWGWASPCFSPPSSENTYPCGRHLVRGVYGQPLRTGITVDQTYDIGRIMDCHFWPFWSQA